MLNLRGFIVFRGFLVLKLKFNPSFQNLEQKAFMKMKFAKKFIRTIFFVFFPIRFY
jgi:hypothetical protein